MGSFNKIGSISGLPISCGDETVLIFLRKNKYNDNFLGGVCYSHDWFAPALLPIFGIYDDYGRIEDIERNSAVDYIEGIFGKDIQSIVVDIDDMAVGRGRESIEPPTGSYEDFTFCLEHRSVYEKLASNKIISYTKEYLPEYWLDKLGFVRIEDNSDSRYKQTWIHKSLPSDTFLHSDGTWGHLIKGGVQVKTSTYHPNELEEAMQKLTNGGYKSSLIEEDKSICSIDLSIVLHKERLEREAKEDLEDMDEIEQIKRKISHFTRGKNRGISSVNDYSRNMYLTGTTTSEYADLSQLILNIDGKIVADFIRFNIGVSRLNAKYTPSNYGSQDQDLELYYDMNRLYRNILLEKAKYHYDEEGDIDFFQKVRQAEREDNINFILEEND
jgi:hypothetical protein